MNRARHALAACVLAGGLLALTACGGGGGGGSSPPGAGAPPATTPAAPSVIASAPAPGGSGALVSLSSDVGDYIGGGASHSYDTRNATVRLTARGAYLRVQVAGRESWSGDFQLPGTPSQLQAGSYDGLSRYPFQAAGAGAMSWSGEGRGCNRLAGSFVIHSVSYQAGLLQSIDLSFQQACEGSAALLRGRVRVDAETMARVMAPQNPQPEQPVLTLASEAGDYIGGGASHAYDHASAVLSVKAEGGLLSVVVQGDESWRGEFKLPAGATTWTPGTYEGLTRYPFQAPAAGGLSWAGEGRGCNVLTGAMTVHSVRYDAGQLSAIDLAFEQHCEGGKPALRGRLRWDASQPPPAASPAAIPPGLWTPPPGAMPDSGNAMYVDSDWGDYIGAGYVYWVGGGGAPAGTTPDVKGEVTVSLTESAGLLRLGLEGAVRWNAEFKGMDGLTRLQPGYYGIVQRYPFHNPRRGGMSFAMDSRGCNKLSGWFVIDEVSYRGDQLASIDLRFAQHCEMGLPALRGRIRWSVAGPVR